MRALAPIFRSMDLTRTEAAIAEEMRRINCGQFENLQIRGGQIVLRPPLRVISFVKFGSAMRPRGDVDFELPKQTVEFINMVRATEEGEIRLLEFRHGLPFRIEIVGDADLREVRR